MGISSKQRKVLSAVILSSILGMGIGAHPVLAQDITNDPATVSTGSSPYFGAQAKGSTMLFLTSCRSAAMPL